MTSEPKLKLKGIRQIGLVVKDLEKAMEAYWTILGIGPWRIYSHGHPMVPVTMYRGRPENYRHRVALADVGALQIELIQHLEGDTIYKEFVEQFGEGVQHLGAFVEDARATVKEAEAAGFKVIQIREKAVPERVYPA